MITYIIYDIHVYEYDTKKDASIINTQANIHTIDVLAYINGCYKLYADYGVIMLCTTNCFYIWNE